MTQIALLFLLGVIIGAIVVMATKAVLVWREDRRLLRRAEKGYIEKRFMDLESKVWRLEKEMLGRKVTGDGK